MSAPVFAAAGKNPPVLGQVLYLVPMWRLGEGSLSWEGWDPQNQGRGDTVPQGCLVEEPGIGGLPRARSQCLKLLEGAPSDVVTKVLLVSDAGASGTVARRSSRALLKVRTVPGVKETGSLRDK